MEWKKEGADENEITKEKREQYRREDSNCSDMEWNGAEWNGMERNEMRMGLRIKTKVSKEGFYGCLN